MRITRALLKKLGACEGGLTLVAPLLPMTFEIDVEKNFDLATELIELYASAMFSGGRRWLVDDLEWLLRRQCASIGYTQLANIYVLRGEAWTLTSNNLLDPLTIAQIMSWIADKDRTG